MTNTTTGGGNGAAPATTEGTAPAPERLLPTRPGWWLAKFNDGPKPVEVVPFNGRLVVFFDSGDVDVETGWIASCWLAEVPPPAECAAWAAAGRPSAKVLEALGEYRVALAAIRPGEPVEADKWAEANRALGALNAAILAERAAQGSAPAGQGVAP